jgi:hypothetical protein
MVFNATFNNISTISWQSVLLVEETGVPRENHWPLVSHWKLYHIMLHRVHSARVGFELTTLVVMDTDCIGSCKSNYHIITAMTSRIKIIIIIIIINNWWNSEATKLGKMMTIKRPTKFRSYPFGPLKLQQNGKFSAMTAPYFSYIMVSVLLW